MSDFFTRHFYAGMRVEDQAGDIGKALEDQGLGQGRMISAVKQCPKGHECFFNACIFVKERRRFRRSVYRQVWWGDIDLTKSGYLVQAAARVCGRNLYVTRERYRWEGYHGEDEGVVLYKADSRDD